MRYRKQIWVSILFDTLFRYLFQVSIPYFDTQFRNRYFSIPHSITNFRYQCLYRYQGIDTDIDTRYRYQRYLTSLRKKYMSYESNFNFRHHDLNRKDFQNKEKLSYPGSRVSLISAASCMTNHSTKCRQESKFWENMLITLSDFHLRKF